MGVEIEQQSLFDYAALDTGTRAFVQDVVRETHALVKQTDDNIIQIGKNVQTLKDTLPHGQFLPLLHMEFGWTERTAQNFMNYARLVEKNERLSFLPREVGYVLGQKSMPDTVIEMVEAGVIPPTIAAIREAKQEVQREEAERDLQREPAPAISPELIAYTPRTPLVDDGPLLAPGFGLVNGKPFDMPLPDGKPVEIPEEWKLPREMRGEPTPPLVEIDVTPVKSATLAALQSSESNEWFTPALYVDAARELMGGIDVDPASNELANKVVRASTYYDIDTNGLDREWTGSVWLNPPYGFTDGRSNQEVWTNRLIEQFTSGVTTEAILLVNANTEAKWFQPLYDYLICFTNHRIRFYNQSGDSSQPTQGNALVYFGSQKRRFIELFSRFGRVVREVKADEY